MSFYVSDLYNQETLSYSISLKEIHKAMYWYLAQCIYLYIYCGCADVRNLFSYWESFNFAEELYFSA